MRILDQDGDKALRSVTLYLTASEAAELRDSLESLLSGPPDSHHHVADADFSKDVTVCLYTPNDPSALRHFDERSKQIILHDA